MALYADLLLPSTIFLEEWGYDHSPLVGCCRSEIETACRQPLGETRAISDILFQLSKNLKGVAPSFANLGDGPEGFVKFRTAPLMPWKEFLTKGVWTGPNYQHKKYGRIFNTPSKKFEFTSGNLRSLMVKKGKREKDVSFLPRYREANFLGKKDEYPFVLIPYQPLMVVENGSQNYPGARDLSPHAWKRLGNLIEINREVGERIGLKNGQVIWVESPSGRLSAEQSFLKEFIQRDRHSFWPGSLCEWEMATGVGVNPMSFLG
jgi:anaerobic selenocysteine-containing dehydrogenase